LYVDLLEIILLVLYVNCFGVVIIRGVQWNIIQAWKMKLSTPRHAL